MPKLAFTIFFKVFARFVFKEFFAYSFAFVYWKFYIFLEASLQVHMQTYDCKDSLGYKCHKFSIFHYDVHVLCLQSSFFFF